MQSTPQTQPTPSGPEPARDAGPDDRSEKGTGVGAKVRAGRAYTADLVRVALFTGVVIARSGSGAKEMFTVRRIVAGEGVERKFPIHSPRIAQVEVVRSAVVRRAKLYYLRERSGKAVRLKERRVDRAKA